MAKALWFLLKPALVMIGSLTLLYPVLLLLCRLTNNIGLFFFYVQGFFVLYDVILGICAAQAISGYAPLALSFGVTRRSLRGAVAAFWVVLPLLCMVLDYLCNSVSARLFQTSVNEVFRNLLLYPMQGLGLKLLLCASMLWLGTLNLSMLPLWKRVLAILLLCVVYLQIAVFMLLGTFLPYALNLHSLALGLLSLPFMAIALHQMKTLAIAQA